MSQTLLIYLFLTMKQRPFEIFFEISIEKHFITLFFLNEKNITTFPFDDTFKMYYCALF